MAASNGSPAPPRPLEHARADGCAILEPPPRPPASPAESNAPREAASLVVIQTKDRPRLGHRFKVERSPLFVGRDADNDIVLPDASVSPRHAHLERRGAEWWCVDDTSAHGLYVDDQPATGEAPLARGTRVGIGSTIFKFLCGKSLEEQYHEEIYRLTVQDGLTQLYVERYLVEALDKEMLRARRRDRPLAVLMMEIDWLSAIEGSSGISNATDHVLTGVAGLLRGLVRRDEVLARRGDDAFVLVLPEHNPDSARAVAERLGEKIASSPLALGGRELRVTVCIGGVQYSTDDRTSADLLERAQRALHTAKSRGQNQLEC